jgi:glycine/D-amino acid oxidase-like deaminating enzyme
VRGVQTNNGPIAADLLVLASGIDTPRLAKMVGVDGPLQESAGLLAPTTPHPRLLEIALAPGTNQGEPRWEDRHWYGLRVDSDSRYQS